MMLPAILLIFTMLLPIPAPDDAAKAYLAEVEHRIMAAWKLPPKIFS